MCMFSYVYVLLCLCYVVFMFRYDYVLLCLCIVMLCFDMLMFCLFRCFRFYFSDDTMLSPKE